MILTCNASPVETSPSVTGITLGCSGRQSLCLVSFAQESASLADALANAGWHVTLLDISEQGTDVGAGTYQYVHLTGLYRETNAYLPLRSLCVYHWLREHVFDVVLFQHDFGVGHYSCIAKQLGLAFEKTVLLAMPLRPLARQFEQSMRLPSGRTDIEQDFMETETVRRADAIVFPDEATETWFRQAGWALPRQKGRFENGAGVALGDWLRSQPAPPSTSPVYISVCLATCDRPHYLEQALQSLAAQTYTDFEVILIDDGSTDPAMATLRDTWASRFKARNWQWIVQDNQGPSAARNRILELGRGTHFLFMDDDNVAYPDELERFACAASHSGADILTCILGLHPDSSGVSDPTAMLPGRGGSPARPVGWTPVGACLALSVFINCFGDTNALIRREVFAKLGGFQGSPRMVFEDIELYTRAIIAGYWLEVVPEILLLYRRHATSRSMGVTIFTSHLESLRPIAELLPPSLRPLLLTLRREWYERHCQRRESIEEVDDVCDTSGKA